MDTPDCQDPWELTAAHSMPIGCAIEKFDGCLMDQKRIIQALIVVGVVWAAHTAYTVAWQWDWWPRRVIMTSRVETPDGNKLKTRHYWQSTRPYFRMLEGRHSGSNKHRYPDKAIWEVELPSGRWVDCGETDANCLAAYEKAMK
jgi:hypothetical protein